jgi:glycosyltransferase involved in cell wall biosynthesis
MKLGIVITSYNDEDTLERAIKSAANLKKKNKIYIVLVDDCSNDSTLKIAKHAKENNQIDLIHSNKKNLGVSNCRNIGINLCRSTDYITFLDADDCLYSDLSKIIEKKNIHADLVAFNFDYFYKNNVGKNKFYNEERVLEITDIKKYFYNYLEKPNKNLLFTTCWSKLYKTKLLVSNKSLYFNQQLYLCEDTDFVFRFLTNSKSVQYIDIPIYLHNLGHGRQNLNKATFGVKLDNKHQLSFLAAVKSCKKYLIKNGDTALKLKNKIDHCIGSYTIIYIIRSCMKINSISSFISTYSFWKDLYNRKVISNKMINYSFERAGGGWLLPFLIKNKMYFVLILSAYFIAKKRYL